MTRHAINFAVMATATLALLSVTGFDGRWVVAAVFGALWVAALFDSIWGD